MNSQIRRLYLVVVGMILVLAFAATYVQFVAAGQLNADSRNSRTILHAAERDRGPIIVAGEAIARSVPIADTKRFQRFYQSGPLYAAVTGWFSSSLSSATGLEAAADDVFEGDAPSLFTQRVQSLVTGSARRGGGTVLTIDPQVQAAAAEAFAGRRGAAVALDPRTGAIRALYSSPSFDPNELASSDTAQADAYWQVLTQDPASPLKNRAIAGDLYPPGSVFKIITAAAMIESGASAQTEVVNDASITLPGTSTHLANITGLPCVEGGSATLADAFARSCNTAFAEGGVRTSEKVMARKAKDFGIGADLRIPLQVTASSYPSEVDDAQLALASIGQGKVSVTPLAMAMVGAAIANGGVIMEPYLVESVVSADLVEQDRTFPKEFSRATTPEVAAQIRDLMLDVVDRPYGTAHGISRGDGSIAAKTGTAETGVEGRTIGWIVAFADAHNPSLVVAVAVEGDDVTPYAGGGSDAGPIARAMLDAGVKR